MDKSADSSTIEFIFDEFGSIHRSKQTTDSFFNLTGEQLHGQNILDYLANSIERYKLQNIIRKLIINPLSKLTAGLLFSYNKLQLPASCECSMESISGENYFLLKILPSKEFNRQETGKPSSIENDTFSQNNNYPNQDNKIKNAELLDIKDKLRNEVNLRKEAEDELRLKDETSNLAGEVTGEGIWDLDILSGDINYNKKFCEIFDVDSEACRDCYITHYESTIVEADKHKFKEAMEKHIAGETPNFNVEHRIKTCKNAYKWVLSKGKVVLKDDEGNPIRFMGRVEDISLRKLAEEEIKKSHRIANELVENKSRFVSMISHEFRTPLSTILSSSDLLRSFSNELTSEEKEKQFNRIEKSIDTLTELLNDILTLNKTDSEKQNVKIESIEFISLCKHLIEEIRSSFKKAPIILFSSNVNRHTIQSDEKLLHQIIINLLTNAMKYNREQNEIKMTVEIGTHVLVSIEDHGIGIKPEDQANLFTPFFRGTNTNGISGTGLGLAIVKSSVESLNGEYWLESEPGIGSTFYVKFPIKPAS
jgi:signal transduction histidine kinase